MQTQFSQEGDVVTVASTQDVQPIIDSCKDLRGLQQGKEMKLAARLPMVIVEAYCHRHNITFEEWTRNKIHVKNMLNDRGLKSFRVWEGRV